MPESIFASKKRKILEQLSIPETEYTDASPKGSVDEGIRTLCDEINAEEGFVTTSSCAGRIAVFSEGSHHKHDGTLASGGKGGGKWLFVSHDPVDTSQLQRDEDIWTLLNIPAPDGEGESGVEPRQFVHFKFEPMILHILTSSLSQAQRLTSAALTSGFRESGISSICGDNPTPLVAIRTQGLALDCIIGYKDDSNNIIPIISAEYLRTMLNVANQRFVVNADRKERFRQALFVRSERVGNWEPAEERRERMRAEGLRRQEAKRREVEASELKKGAVEDGSESLEVEPSLGEISSMQ